MHLSSNQKSRQEIIKRTLTASNDIKQHGSVSPLVVSKRSLLCDVPPESRTHITSYLDPQSLLALSQTCSLLHAHVKDESTWYNAFLCQFLGVKPEGELEDDKSLLLRRLERNWRLEFAFRHRIRRRWQRSRNTTVVHSPVHSYVWAMHPLPNNGLLTCSLRYGIVARSHPLNGKIVKGFLSASGGGAGLGIGNPNMEFAPDVTACALGSDGSTAKVAWGYRNGQVAIVLSKKAMDGKIASDYTRCSVSDDHEGAVVDVAWDGDMVVTAGDDGRMKVWQKRHSAILCLWSSTKDESAVIPPKCIKLVSALSNGYVACVMNNGDVIVWHGFILHGELDVDNISTTRVRSLYSKQPVESSVDDAPQVLALHADKTVSTPTLLLAYYQQSFFHKIVIAGNTDVRISTFGDRAFRLTSLAPFFTAEPTERPFVLAGDNLGTVGIYAWDSGASTSPTTPLRTFDVQEDGSAITALASNGAVLVTGSARGAIHVWDALTLDRLRSFDVLETRSASGHASPLSAVRAIAFSGDKETLLVSVNDEVLAWKVGHVPKSSRHVVVAAKNKGRAQRERIRFGQKIEMQESMATMYDEYGDGRTGKYGDARKDQHTARKDALAQQAKMENLGLDESEMMEYVMMLSREEASEREREAERMAELFGSSMAVDEGPTAFDTGPSAVHGRGFAADDGVFEGDFDEVPSPSVDDSSVLDTDDSPGSSGVSSLSYASSSGGPSIPGGPSPFGGPSPPPGPSSPPSGRPSPPHGQPIYPSPSLPSPPLAPASLDDPAVFPSISPQSPSSSMRASPSSSVRSAWSQPLKMSPTSSRKASFASSPSVKGTIARARTVTTSTRRVSASASGSGAWGSSGAGTGAWNTVTGATSTSASGAAARARTTSGGAWGTGSNNWVVTGPASPSVNAPAPPSIWPVTRSMTTPYSVVASSASGDVTQGHGVVRGMGTTDMGAMHHSSTYRTRDGDAMDNPHSGSDAEINMDHMDDDLRLAIELSLAEARSRGEAA